MEIALSGLCLIYGQLSEISTKLSFIAEIPDSEIFECLPRTCQYLKLAR